MSDVLWDTPISNPLRHRAHSIITRWKTKTELIQYIHGFYFRPTPRIFPKAINNGNFLTWPGLNNQILLKHLPPIIVTALGHLDQEWNNLQSTKQLKSELEIEEDKYFHPDIWTVNTHELCATIAPFNIKRKGFRYLTEVFPHKSIRETYMSWSFMTMIVMQS